MIPALVSLKSLIKNKSYHIDHPLFRLHYQATVCTLLSFCLILTAKILFGDTIDCKSRLGARDEFSDNMCYSLGTFTYYADQLPANNSTASIIRQTRTTIPPEEPEMDDNHEHKSDQDNMDPATSRYMYTGILIPREGHYYRKTLWHRYYQYIPVILFLQAVFFYLPHYIWKCWENGIVSSICKQLHDNRFAPSSFMESNYHMIDYLQHCFQLHRSLVFKYHFCHTLLLINLIGQVIVLDSILNKQFIDYGYNVILYQFNQNLYGFRDMNGKINPDLNNPMDYVFPKVTGCTINYLSQAGKSLDEHQYLCVLPLNIFHDKFFLLLWFWFLLLGVLTIIQVAFDSLYVLLPMFRRYRFKTKFGPYLKSSSLFELFLLDLIGSNSDKFAFSALLDKLNKKESLV